MRITNDITIPAAGGKINQKKKKKKTAPFCPRKNNPDSLHIAWIIHAHACWLFKSVMMQNVAFMWREAKYFTALW